MRRLLVGLSLAASAGACGRDPGTAHDDPDAIPSPIDAAPADAFEAGFRVQYVDPEHGPFSGNTEITVRGNGFAEDDEVWIGGRRVLDQEFVDERRFTVLTPPGE